MSVHIFAYLSPGTICFSNTLFSNFSLQTSLKTFFQLAQFLNQVNAKPGLLKWQTAVRIRIFGWWRPDLDSLLKGVLDIQMFLYQNVGFLAVFLN